MKIFILCIDPSGKDFQMHIKICNPSVSSREAQREHAKSQHRADYVWFEDEEPPDRLVEIIQEARGCQDFLSDQN